jgi:hypothetical protein
MPAGSMRTIGSVGDVNTDLPDPGTINLDRDRTNTSTRPTDPRGDAARMGSGQGFNGASTTSISQAQIDAQQELQNQADREQSTRSGVRATDASNANGSGAPAGTPSTNATVAGSLNLGLTEIGVLAAILFAYVQLT